MSNRVVSLAFIAYPWTPMRPRRIAIDTRNNNIYINDVYIYYPRSYVVFTRSIVAAIPYSEYDRAPIVPFEFLIPPASSSSFSSRRLVPPLLLFALFAFTRGPFAASLVHFHRHSHEGGSIRANEHVTLPDNPVCVYLVNVQRIILL